jgi:hypothetical protein
MAPETKINYADEDQQQLTRPTDSDKFLPQRLVICFICLFVLSFSFYPYSWH